MSTVTVTGTLTNAITGAALVATGWVETSTDVLVDTVAGKVLLEGAPVTIDINGAFSVPLRPVDDAGLNPQEFTYRLKFRLGSGEVKEWTFRVHKADGPTIDWTRLVVVSDSSGTPYVMGPAGPAGAAGTAGTNGLNGAQGLQGIQGIQGPQGPAGTSAAVSYVRLYRATAQSVSSSTATEVLWDAETEDTDGYHDLVTNTGRLTVPTGKDGIFTITATNSWLGDGTGNWRTCSVYKNGVKIADIGSNKRANESTSSNPTNVACTVAVRLVAGDYIQIFGFQDATPAINLQANITTVQMARLGS